VKSHPSSLEFPAIVKPRRPSSEAIRSFLQEHRRQKEWSEKLMDADDAAEMSDEMKDSEAADADKEVNDADVMCDDSVQEPPDHIKLVMEV